VKTESFSSNLSCQLLLPNVGPSSTWSQWLALGRTGSAYSFAELSYTVAVGFLIAATQGLVI
jgi:phage terminase large subunit-like protein